MEIVEVYRFFIGIPGFCMKSLATKSLRSVSG